MSAKVLEFSPAVTPLSPQQEKRLRIVEAMLHGNGLDEVTLECIMRILQIGVDEQ